MRNSGFETTSSGTLARLSTRACSASHVPTGTVLFTTTSALRRATSAMRSPAASTALMSAPPSAPCGVPTATKYASASWNGGTTVVSN